jgi:hypothetical protein
MTRATQWFNERVTPFLNDTSREERAPAWLEGKSHRTTTIELHIMDGEETEVMMLDLAEAPGRLATKEREKTPGVCIFLTQETLEQIQSGKLSGRAAYAKGLIKTKGSRHLASHLYNLLKPTFG